MKVRIIRQPSGLINGELWPAAGEHLELPDAVAESMAEVGHVEIVKAEKAPKTEKRPAPTAGVEKRGTRVRRSAE